MAIILAVFNHPPLHSFVPKFSGVIGVHLFFVISGFVITRTLLRLLPRFEPSTPFRSRLKQSLPALRTFFIRRFFRIVPLAVLSSLLFLCSSAFFNSTHVIAQPSNILLQIVSIFTLTYNYCAFDIGHDLLLFWSLNVEEHFYLALPFFFLAVPQTRARTGLMVATALTIALIARPLTAPFAVSAIEFWRYSSYTHVRIDTLAAGVALGLLTEIYWLRRPRSTIVTKAVGKLGVTLGIAALIFLQRYFHIQNQWVWALLDLTAVGLVLAAGYRRGYVLNTPIVSWVFEYLGSRSYTIYLLHIPVWCFTAELLNLNPYLSQYYTRTEIAVVWSALTLAVTELTFRYFEQPLTQFGRRWSA